MAKYVGRIFKVNNAALKIKRSGAHYVHVQWYNPFTRRFRCKVITSLEDRMELEGDKRKILGTTPFSIVKGNTFAVFDKRKYERIRRGKITPLPVSRTEGFGVWVGYEDTRDLHISELKGKRAENMRIKK